MPAKKPAAASKATHKRKSAPKPIQSSPPESSRLGRVSEWLDGLGDGLLALILILLAFQFVAGVVVLAWLVPGATYLNELVEGWPIWIAGIARATILLGTIVLIVVAIWWLFDDIDGVVVKLVELRKNPRFKRLLQPVRGMVYCAALFSVLKAVWADYGELRADPAAWLGMLRKVMAVLWT